MPTKKDIRHIISTTKPPGLSPGDEWFNPSTNKLYKQLIINGTTSKLYEVNVTEGAASVATPTEYKYKNRIINGSMLVDQRNNGGLVTYTTTGLPANGSPYCVDKFSAYNLRINGSTLTIQQTIGGTPPSGFGSYLVITNTTGGATVNTDNISLYQGIEGFNVADLLWGTANAKPITLSFNVRVSVPGVYAFAIRNGSTNRCYVNTFNVPVANTWTYITSTIPGDTTGTWYTNSNCGMYVSFDLGCGTDFSTSNYSVWQAGNYFGANTATKLSNTTGGTFHITGIQVEPGTEATEYEHRPYSQVLADCQRYCELISTGDVGVTNSATSAYTVVRFSVPKRYTSYTLLAPAGTYYLYTYGTGMNAGAIPPIMINSYLDMMILQRSGHTSLTVAQACFGTSSSTAMIVNADY